MENKKRFAIEIEKDLKKELKELLDKKNMSYKDFILYSLEKLKQYREARENDKRIR